MKERPIIFSGPMVSAILAGRKTQTRRVIKDPQDETGGQYCIEYADEKPDQLVHLHNPKCSCFCDYTCNYPCPFGQPGDRLWVRETFYCNAGEYYFRADMPDKGDREAPGWRPSIHMPRAESRITLEITAVRVERLQVIPTEDALAEGYQADITRAPVTWYRELWDSINGKRPGCSWTANPWVWVIEFKRIK